MSRSYRKTPIFGHTTAQSEAADKRLWHKRWRTQERDLLITLPADHEHCTTLRNAVSSSWDMSKDGKSWFDPAKQQQVAERIATKHADEPSHRQKLVERTLAKWRSK